MQILGGSGEVGKSVIGLTQPMLTGFAIGFLALTAVFSVISHMFVKFWLSYSTRTNLLSDKSSEHVLNTI